MEIEKKWAQPIHNRWSFIIKPYLGMGLFHFSIVINGRVLFLYLLSSDLIFAYLFGFIYRFWSESLLGFILESVFY